MPGMVTRALAGRCIRPVLMVVMLVAACPAAAQVTPQRPFGTLREQATLQQAWLRQRLDTFLPGLMRKHGIDMWVVPMREYNEDPVFAAIVAPDTFAARRRTIYVFFDTCAASGQPAAAACVAAHRPGRHLAGRGLRGAPRDHAGRGASAVASRPSCGATTSGRC